MSTIVPPTRPEQDDEFTLATQRFQQSLYTSSHGVTHVLLESTFKAHVRPGFWTRRGWDRRALCGSLRAVVVGSDAAVWPEERQRVSEPWRIDCNRCQQRYNTWLSRRGDA